MPNPDGQPLIDRFGRTMRDLRISVTDRCNLRCLYCLPETEAAANFYRERTPNKSGTNDNAPIEYRWKPKSEILTFDEVARLAKVFVGLGVNKLRLTGGEPLLRRDFPKLVRMLASIPGVDDLAMTTNGFRFKELGAELQEAGLTRVSFSLDAMDPVIFKLVTGRDGFEETLTAIEHAISLGIRPVKVNAVIIRDLNENQIIPLIEYARRTGIILRFIEFMPLDSKRAWMREMVVTKAELLQTIQDIYPCSPFERSHPSETATRWRLDDGSAEFGIIAPVTEPFCGRCNRLRLTVDGQLRTCLFSLSEFDLKPVLRSAGSTDADIESVLRERVWLKEERHHIGEVDYVQPARSMSRIGG